MGDARTKPALPSDPGPRPEAVPEPGRRGQQHRPEDALPSDPFPRPEAVPEPGRREQQHRPEDALPSDPGPRPEAVPGGGGALRDRLTARTTTQVAHASMQQVVV